MANPVRDFLLDANNDLAIVNGDFAGVSGQAAVQQGINTRLGMLRGESAIDQTVGVPWLDILSTKNQDPIIINDALRAPIIATPDVTSVTDISLTIDPKARALSAYYATTSTYSETPVVGTTPVEI